MQPVITDSQLSNAATTAPAGLARFALDMLEDAGVFAVTHRAPCHCPHGYNLHLNKAAHI